MSAAGFGAVAPGAAVGAATVGGPDHVIILIAMATGTLIAMAMGTTDTVTGSAGSGRISEDVLVVSRGRPVLCDARQDAVERSDEMRTLVAQRETAWLKDVARQKISRQRKSIG